MQHRISRMFLGPNGTLTPYIWEAREFEDLGGAVRECHKYCLSPSDFSFRVFEEDPAEELQAFSSR